MSGKKYYCFCDSNCKYETMTKEQILAAIAQAAESGLVFDEDAAIVSKVKETNAGKGLSFWVGTQAQYNALGGVGADCFPIITDAMPYAEIAPVLQAHIVRTDNPHNVTKEQLGAAAAIAEKMTLQYASVHAAPNDLLSVTLSGDYNAPNMQHSHIATEDASQLVNSPITSGAFYAVREVEWYWVGHVCVRLREMYPNNGRVWSNMYDKNLKNWTGWTTPSGSSGDYAPAKHHHYGTHPFVEFTTTSTGAFPAYGMLISRGANSYGASTGDNYYIGLDYKRGLKVGTQLNGVTDITWDNVLTQTLPSSAYGDTLPAAGTAGRIFFKKV